MTVERYERMFLALGGALLVVCVIALFVGSMASGIHLPGAEGRIDPSKVTTTPPFDHPGVRQLGTNSYEVVVTGKAWQFNPKEIRLPVGADVTFTATTMDVIHGFSIEGTRLNMMLIPGQIITQHIPL